MPLSHRARQAWSAEFHKGVRVIKRMEVTSTRLTTPALKAAVKATHEYFFGRKVTSGTATPSSVEPPGFVKVLEEHEHWLDNACTSPSAHRTCTALLPRMCTAFPWRMSLSPSFFTCCVVRLPRLACPASTEILRALLDAVPTMILPGGAQSAVTMNYVTQQCASMREADEARKRAAHST